MEKTTAQALIIAHLMKGTDFNYRLMASELAARDPVLFCSIAGLRDVAAGEQWARDVIGHLEANALIPAIKEVRSATGMGLKESKDAIDCFREPGRVFLHKISAESQQVVRALREAYGFDVFKD